MFHFFACVRHKSPLSIESRSEDDDADTRDHQVEVDVVQYSLRAMIINPSKKGDYIMTKVDKSAAKSITLSEMKQFILSNFLTNVPQLDIDKVYRAWSVADPGS